MVTLKPAGLLALILVATPAWAQPPQGEAEAPSAATTGTAIQESVVPTRGERAGPAPRMLSLAVGLGVSNFRGALNNNLGVGPSWDLRAGVGNDTVIGGELAYVGTAHSLRNADNDLGAGVDGTAVATMGDAMVRFNATHDGAWQPFAAVGLGLLSLDVRDAETTVDRGTALTIPLSAGLNFYTGRRMLIGGRVNYRVLTEIVDNDIPSGDEWNAGLSVGATF